MFDDMMFLGVLAIAGFIIGVMISIPWPWNLIIIVVLLLAAIAGFIRWARE